MQISDTKNNFINYSIINALLFVVFYSANCKADIEINEAYFVIKDQYYYLYADLEFDLNKETRKALLHGIALHIKMRIDVFKDRSWWWAKKPVQQQLILRLQYLPLSSRYVVTNLANGRSNSFSTLAWALNNLGNISNTIFFDKKLLAEDSSYQAVMKVYLDIDSLPAPMHPVAYLSSGWKDLRGEYSWFFSP